MQIGVLKERRAGEHRVAASPDTVKKLIAAGCKVVVETGAGAGSQLSDTVFTEAGATIVPNAAAAAASDLVVKIQKPMTAAEGTDEVSYLKSGSVLMANLMALTSKDLMQVLAKQGVTAFALELIERGQDCRADRMGRGVHRYRYLLHDQMLVKSEAQPHVVDRRSRGDGAASFVVKIVGFDVDQMAFDLEQAVIANVAVHGQRAPVPVLAWGGGWRERHRNLR